MPVDKQYSGKLEERKREKPTMLKYLLLESEFSGWEF